MEIIISLASGLVIGTVLGLLGGGGALMAIPILIYVLAFPFRAAIGNSLVLVMVGALPAVLLYAQKRQINWLSALWMGISGALGASLGSHFSARVPHPVLLGLLIVLMVLSAINMLRTRPSSPDADKSGQDGKWILGLAGLAIGVLTGMVGVGGGFLLVPALLFFGKLEPRNAIATSLVIIGINAASGALGYWELLPLGESRFWLVTAGCLVGSIGGFWLSFRLPQGMLKQGFAFLLLALIVLLIVFPPN